MKQSLLVLSLLFSANLVCEEEAWTFSGPTYEDILFSYSIPDLKKEKLNLQKEFDQCSDSTQRDKLQGKLNSVEKTITSMKKAADKALDDYRKEVQGYSLKKLEHERAAYKRSLNIDPKYIDEIRRETNAIIEQELVILEAEIEKRKQAQ